MIELNKLYNENNLDTMGRMPDCFLDLTVTSPPYDNLRYYKGSFKFPFKHTARHLYSVTKWGGVVVWVVNDATVNGSETGTSFRQALFFMECGFRLHDTMIYKKKNYVPLTHNRYEQCFEYMFIFSKGRPTTFNPFTLKTSTAGDKKNYGYTCGSTIEKSSMRTGANRIFETNSYKIKENIFEYNIGKNQSSKDDIAFDHPAIFNEALASDQIKSWSNEGDIVYDPFVGSGTTLKMAHLLQRKWIGSEISKEYCELAEKRLDPYLKQQSLFTYQ